MTCYEIIAVENLSKDENTWKEQKRNNDIGVYKYSMIYHLCKNNSYWETYVQNKSQKNSKIIDWFEIWKVP